MICPAPLSKQQMSDSRKNMIWYNLVNGLSYMCLGETVIILFAVRLNAPNYVVAILGSMLYFGFLLLPLGKIMTARVGAAQSQADFWVCRNIAVLMVAAAAPAALFLNSVLALLLLVIGAFFFYGFRAAGVVMGQPLAGEICEPEIREKYLSACSSTFYAAGMAALLVISFLMKCTESLWMLTGIILAGSVLGITSSGFIRKVCETDQIRESARKPMFETLKQAAADQMIRRQLLAGAAANLIGILTVPISMLALKRGFSVSDTGALLYSMVQFGSMVGAGLLMTCFTAQLGPKKLILIGHGILFCACLFWIVVPANVHPLLLVLPFLFCGAGTIVSENSRVAYFLMSVRKDLQVTAAMLISLATGVGSGLLGMTLGSLLLKAAERLNAGGIPSGLYRIYFLLLSGVFLLCSIFLFRLKTVIHEFRREHGEEAVRETVSRTPHKS